LVVTVISDSTTHQEHLGPVLLLWCGCPAQTLKTLTVKALGAMCSIGAGLVAGKEGPFIQVGTLLSAGGFYLFVTTCCPAVAH
jgi:hypothetical protein